MTATPMQALDEGDITTDLQSAIPLWRPDNLKDSTITTIVTLTGAVMRRRWR